MREARSSLEHIRIKCAISISLFREHSGRTNDMDTIEFATFRYDTVEVENGLKPCSKL